MSLILDALRKMEQERNARRGAAQDLRPSVLRYRGAPRETRKMPYLKIAAGVVLVGAGLAVGMLWKGSPAVPPAGEVRQETGPAAVVRAEPTPATSQPAQAPLPQPPVPQAAATATQLPVPGPAEPVPAPQVEPSRTKRAPAAAKSRQQEPAAALPAAATPLTGQPPGDISLSGIAWQDERSLRRAVLNGSLVGEGAQVAGARVVEIREDRVRLSRGGQLFEVQLSSAATAR